MRVNAAEFRQYAIDNFCEKCGRPFDAGHGKDGIVITFRTIQCGEAIARLTPREQQLLETLLRVYPHPATQERLYANVWGWESDVQPKTMQVVICKLNKTLAPLNLQISNSRGVGYGLTKYVDR